MIEYKVTWYSDYGGYYFVEKFINGNTALGSITFLFTNTNYFGPETYTTRKALFKTSRQAIAKLKSMGLKLSKPMKVPYNGHIQYIYKDLSE